jgi:hypothetical protein
VLRPKTFAWITFRPVCGDWVTYGNRYLKREGGSSLKHIFKCGSFQELRTWLWLT